MFETSLLPERKGKDARLVRSIAIGSLVLQATAVTAFIVIPLFFPASLPAISTAPKMTRLELRKAPIKVTIVKPEPVPVTNHAALSAPSHAAPTQAPRLGSLSHASGPPVTDAEPLLAIGDGKSMASPLAVGSGSGSLFGTPNGTTVVATKPAAPKGPLTISSGVSQGMLLSAMRPVYPRIAVASRTEGTVIITAVIDRSGRIVNVVVLSGPAMLRQAAEEAVREARYKPYLLNGLPTEVVTTVSVKFQLNGNA